MALSDTFSFTLTRDGLIKRTLLLLGVISADQTVAATEYTNAGEVLNLMLKAWQADGMQLWQVTGKSITPVKGQATYTIGPAGGVVVTGKPVALLEAYRRNTAEVSDIALIRQSRTQYWELNDKDMEGTPTQYYWDIQQGVGANDLLVWPTPDQDFVDNNTIEILYQAPFDDMTISTSNLAFPQEWELAVVYGLAVILAPEYGLPLSSRQLLRSEAKEEKQRVLDWDQEQTSIFFQPATRFR